MCISFDDNEKEKISRKDAKTQSAPHPMKHKEAERGKASQRKPVEFSPLNLSLESEIPAKRNEKILMWIFVSVDESYNFFHTIKFLQKSFA
jgi:hypothetical protein